MESTYSRFAPGDVVTVLPYREISEKFTSPMTLPSGCYFRNEMKIHCELDYVVERVIDRRGDVNFYRLSGLDWYFTDEMLMMPPENASNNIISFDEIMNFDN